MTMKIDRLFYLDNITGIFIIHMIFVCHIGILDNGFYSNNAILQGLSLLCGCFMSWFFFKSGMFYKPTENIRKFIKQLSKKLLVPYVVFCGISYPIDLLITKHNTSVSLSLVEYLSPLKEIIIREATISNCAVWFLLSLFIVQVSVQLLNKKYNMLIVSVMGG